VVAPPDAVAATAIARRIGLPRRVVTILEGESLLNDATALVALRTSIGAAAGVVSVLHIGWDFLVAAGGGVGVGLLAYVVVAWVRKHVTDPVLDTSVSLVTPFAAYVAAESFHASGVLAVVVAGLALGHRAPILQTPSSRIAERLNWRTISFLLEHLVFLLIGLQARDILDAVVQGDVPLATVLWACAATLLAVIGTRLLWVFPARFLLVRPDADPQTGQRPSWGYTTVIGWAGMRGVVTLAAAFVIPADFPQRDLLVLIALAVTAGTLFLQGSSLPWLVRRLRLPGPDPREDALARAALLQEAGAAGRAWLDEHTGDDDPTGAVAAVRDRVERRDFAAWERLGDLNPDAETPSEAYARLRRDMLDVERNRVLEIRSTGRVPHEVVAEVLATLDLEESMLDLRSERDARAREANRETVVTGAVGVTVDACEHLREAPADPRPEPAVECQDCVAEGLTVWVHLRTCLACGHVGCCDSSPRRHATAHFHETGHPVIRSAEPGEHWRWCYVDERLG
jgi:CPA1 family monovalent cation:H+ antiporter